jgi:Ni,Fe-hydrogenase maturation factor
MPEEVRLVAIEAQELLTVSEEMSAAVENAVPKAVSLILELISEFKGSYVE